ncbi:hypothetical protein HPP92_026679 [Vanilla planifolia]|uniref:Uncharacterized protein n=1 Tax=Vanilla planifolia TaxID=51239 RepID=A0A835PBZ7_VANPL|nr:hypothetical protein HPP92_026679 [Vanilla planifolia]
MELLGKIVFHGPAAALRDFLCCCTELNRLLPGSNGPSCAPPRAEKDVIFRRVGDGGEEQRTVEAAVRGLGMEWGEGEGAMGAVEELLAEKEASEWELEEAFYVLIGTRMGSSRRRRAKVDVTQN